MAFIELWSYLTVAVTLLMFMTGILPCLNMYRTKSTANVPFHMFLLGALGCQGMFHYGLMLDMGIIIFLNGIGMVIQGAYSVLYILVSRSKTRPLTYVALSLLYEVVLYLYLYKAISDPTERADMLGSCSSLLTTLIMTLPAFEVISNIRNKNADGMPLVMLLGGLVCSSCWLVYGVLLEDPNVYSPNIPGLVITLAKLYIIWLYAEKRKTD